MLSGGIDTLDTLSLHFYGEGERIAGLNDPPPKKLCCERQCPSPYSIPWGREELKSPSDNNADQFARAGQTLC